MIPNGIFFHEGAGLFPYYIGISTYLQENYDLRNTSFAGCSTGCFPAIALSAKICDGRFYSKVLLPSIKDIQKTNTQNRVNTYREEIAETQLAKVYKLIEDEQKKDSYEYENAWEYCVNNAKTEDVYLLKKLSAQLQKQFTPTNKILRQPFTFEGEKQLIQKAKCVSKSFHEKLRNIIQETGGNYIEGPLKLEDRIRNKAHDDYENELACVLDIIRGTGVFENIYTFGKAISKFISLSRSNDLLIIRAKDRINKPVHGCGYRDLLINVEINGFVGELQLSLSKLLEIKFSSHRIYNLSRALQYNAQNGFIFRELMFGSDWIKHLKKHIKTAIIESGNFHNIKNKCLLLVPDFDTNNLNPEFISKWDTIDDLIDFCITSSWIPVIFGGFFKQFRNKNNFDKEFRNILCNSSVNPDYNHNWLHIDLCTFGRFEKNIFFYSLHSFISLIFSANEHFILNLINQGYIDAKNNDTYFKNFKKL